jgi:glycosyltransferase involved in cell wall biosynthesis
MRVLALEPHYGGSHRAFLDGWIRHSRHDWTVLGLPAYHWKWRMRHGAVSLAEHVFAAHEGERWDVLFCSDMLDLPAFLGHARRLVADVPTVVYFHENQLTYPVRHEDERDLHYAITNLNSAHAADSVWFNSAFHRDEMLHASGELMARLPAGLPDGIIAGIERKSVGETPGIDPISPSDSRSSGPLRILWAARWEFDKCPEDFFAALNVLVANDVDFRVSVVGEQFRAVPPVFAEARERLHDRIDRWGYQQSRAEYVRCLQEADVVVSTAVHEFFGLSMIEAISAGAHPLLPRRLAYPEILAPLGDSSEAFFYDGTVEDLARQLEDHVARLHRGGTMQCNARQAVERFSWNRRALAMDDRLEEVASRSHR